MSDQQSELPEVLNVKEEGSQCVLSVRVPDNCKWFDGHFEGAPILSGVAQIDWMMTLAERYLKLDRGFAGLEVLKFHNVIQPGDELDITLNWVREKHALRFEINGAARCSSGRVLLQAGVSS